MGITLPGVGDAWVWQKGIWRNIQHLPMNEFISGEVECIDFDVGLLPGVDEADVAVRDGRLDHEQRLGRRDDSAYGTHGSCCTTPSIGAVNR